MMYFHFVHLVSVLSIWSLGTAQQDDLSLALNMVNQARQVQGLQPLAWEPNLVAYAGVWAKQIASGQVPFSHAQGSMRPQQGENLFEQQSSVCDAAYDIPLQTAMQTWLAQAALYTGQPITTGAEPWLHWCKPLLSYLVYLLIRMVSAQCMWSTSTHIGCAWAYSILEPYKVFDVCRFYPEGNV